MADKRPPVVRPQALEPLAAQQNRREEPAIGAGTEEKVALHKRILRRKPRRDGFGHEHGTPRLARLALEKLLLALRPAKVRAPRLAGDLRSLLVALRA
ncbi:MAG: hypothetical protein Q8R01_18175 [Ramlibacter sp.]|nr:hypothetical protein [Ramlibacter sp.]